MSDVYRREEKFILSLEQFYTLRKQLEGHMQPDEHSGNTGYIVRSLYFDSCYDQDLFDVLDGLENKSKIRLRIYNPASFVDGANLEHKCKSGVASHKIAVSLTVDEALCIASGDYSPLIGHKAPAASLLYARLKLSGYRPKVIVEYRRIAYTYVPNNIRITFDSRIESCSVISSFFESKLSGIPVLPSGLGVLEVKYNQFLFGHIKKILVNLENQASSYSKYANSRLTI